MRIVFSRKGFDSAAGGGPSPIVGGRPLSLPIPAGAASRTSYDALGLGEGDKIDGVDGREGLIGHDGLTARTGSTDADPEMFPPPDTCRLLPVGDFGVQRSKVRWSERFPIRSAK